MHPDVCKHEGDEQTVTSLIVDEARTEIGNTLDSWLTSFRLRATSLERTSFNANLQIESSGIWSNGAVNQYKLLERINA